jgi:hypothetical protein
LVTLQTEADSKNRVSQSVGNSDSVSAAGDVNQQSDRIFPILLTGLAVVNQGLMSGLDLMFARAMGNDGYSDALDTPSSAAHWRSIRLTARSTSRSVPTAIGIFPGWARNSSRGIEARFGGRNVRCCVGSTH